jgi:hypothetical protein
VAAVDDLDRLIEQYDKALDEFVKGNPEPMKDLFSHREYVTLSNPYFPVGHGWEEVAQRLEGASSNFRDGEMTSFETVEKYVTPELAYEVRVERAKVGGSEELSPQRVALILTRTHHTCTIGRVDFSAEPSVRIMQYGSITLKSAAVAVRVTTIFRPEDGEWKVVHRHGDPITTPPRQRNQYCRSSSIVQP